MTKTKLFLLLYALPVLSWAALPAPNAWGILPLNQEGLAPALKIMSVLTVLSLAPGILIMLSSFTRIVVVLSMLRTALGLQQTPPNTILISLSLFLTFFTMMPVLKAVYNEAYQPYVEQQIDYDTALQKAIVPLKQFMFNQTREKDLQLIIHLANETLPTRLEDVAIYHLIPAFLLSELQTAFHIGFMIFLPFLLIDLIVSGLLATIGMMMMPPATLALPIKILLFVLIDGWNLVVEGLVSSFN